MSGQFEVLITFLLYIAFFGWIGYLRGTLSEGIVFGVALTAWLILQEQGDIFVRVINLGSKGIAFVQAGGLGENPDEAFGAISSASPWVTADTRGGFLFVLWAFLLFLTYIVTGPRFLGKKSRGDGWSVILGVLNGLLYATILLPRLVLLLQPAEITDAADGATSSISSFFGILGGGVDLLRGSLGGLWEIFEPSQQSLILLILLTLFLLLVAGSLRGGTRKA
ncbi:MAG TPA: hypothetical protein P5121_19995 [Caldilineaceae bacterium]|nr:hypothetical protein [Caldilineaceae bacterium]